MKNNENNKTIIIWYLPNCFCHRKSASQSVAR